MLADDFRIRRARKLFADEIMKAGFGAGDDQLNSHNSLTVAAVCFLRLRPTGLALRARLRFADRRQCLDSISWAVREAQARQRAASRNRPPLQNINSDRLHSPSAPSLRTQEAGSPARRGSPENA